MDLLDDDAMLMATAEQGGGVGNLLRDSVHRYHDPHGYYHDVDEETYYHSRYLQAPTNFTETEGLTDTEIIRTTCKLYGSVFLALFVVFLIVRQAFPSVYNLKKSYEHLYIPLASQPYGMISWMWSVFVVQYDDIAEQCGMDAVTTIRMFEFGVKISFVAVLNSAYLFPIYKYMGTVVTNDNAKELSLSNLPSFHNGTIATAIAAYIFFGCAMHFVDKDFEWLTEHRHKFLAKKRVQNYSIFLSNLPEKMRSDTAIKEYFKKCFAHDAVIDGDVALNTPKLTSLYSKREALVAKFEHAINVLTVKGEEPMHSTKLCGGEKVESIPVYKAELEEMNKEISETIDRIVADKESRKAMDEEDYEAGYDIGEGAEDVENTSTGFGTNPDQPVGVSAKSIEAADGDAEGEGEGGDIEDGAKESALENGENVSNSGMKHSSSQGSGLDEVLGESLAVIKSLVVTQEGSPRSAAFVTFADLVSANMALQSIHNHEPWDMVSQNAPRPDLVNWSNVGVSNQALQIGELISLALTTTLCILWTIPVSFVASFSNVEGLVQIFPALQEPIEKYPWFSNFMAQIAPLILVVFISILPYILLFFVTFEKPIERASMQHPSLLSKLSAFTIIQTFFISTISGSLFQSIQDIIDNPTSAVELVATALPAQSAYFIQLIIVQNLLALGIELLRISPIAQEWLGTLVKKIFGYNLTEKERNTSFLGIRDIADPLEYYFGRELGSKTILLMMVLYVYGCMSPVTAYFTLAIFLLIAMGFRNQFIYIYPIANDSGGKLWLNFTKMSVTCMILAEIILCAVLFLKGGVVAGPLMVPLIVITILFDIYFKKRHYMTTNFLPLGDCAATDEKNKEEGMTYEWLVDAYLQPQMKDRLRYPDNYGRIDEEYAAQQKAARELEEKKQMEATMPKEDAAAVAEGPAEDIAASEGQKGGCIIS
eukprot:CAMPEP_0178517898 /NCGR_PEP_ID=MMETSP0696-20121128/25950_1 /TAXON_ID=265572 /ORGANISM="Extubocellulus spinifer, Strain CCMP396" /LENGTH=936 /DNA_ID=CAMNT_0020148387 /DNA_START=89 /DNA_END=2899 /DNA_ORIENTATION=-